MCIIHFLEKSMNMLIVHKCCAKKMVDGYKCRFWFGRRLQRPRTWKKVSDHKDSYIRKHYSNSKRSEHFLKQDTFLICYWRFCSDHKHFTLDNRVDNSSVPNRSPCAFILFFKWIACLLIWDMFEFVELTMISKKSVPRLKNTSALIWACMFN